MPAFCCKENVCMYFAARVFLAGQNLQWSCPTVGSRHLFLLYLASLLILSSKRVSTKNKEDQDGISSMRKKILNLIKQAPLPLNQN